VVNSDCTRVNGERDNATGVRIESLLLRAVPPFRAGQGRSHGGFVQIKAGSETDKETQVSDRLALFWGVDYLQGSLSPSAIYASPLLVCLLWDRALSASEPVVAAWLRGVIPAPCNLLLSSLHDVLQRPASKQVSASFAPRRPWMSSSSHTQYT
jgi:hypothetical protein